MTIARFRADPQRVRIAVRKHGGLWLASVGPRDGSEQVITWLASNPCRAVLTALKAAQYAQLPGVDLGMQWAYEHPWR